MSFQEAVIVDLLKRILKELQKVSADTDALVQLQIPISQKETGAAFHRHRPS